MVNQTETNEKQPYGYAFSLLFLEGKDAPDVKQILTSEMNLSESEASELVERVQEDGRRLRIELEIKEVKRLLLIGFGVLAAGILLTWLLTANGFGVAFIGLMTFGGIYIVKALIKWGTL